jgi:hypothetical protein
MARLSGAAPGELAVRWSELTNAPSRLHRNGVPLTEPSSGGAETVARRFVAEQADLLALSQTDVAALRVTEKPVTASTGVTHVKLQQSVHGTDVFGCALEVNVDSRGRVLSSGGEALSSPEARVNAAQPRLDAAAAVAAGAQASGVKHVRETDGEILVYFPLATGNLRLAWSFTVQDASSPYLYRMVVDAVDGALLYRLSLTHFEHIDAHGEVFASDSPIPNTPRGTSTGSIARTDQPFHGGLAFPHDDVHFDWWAGGARTTTTSNNVDAFTDRNGDNAADAGSRPSAGAGESFTFALDLSQDPNTYSAAAVANLFYWNNRLHDYFYELGFDEASGNFQSNNFGLGGSGGDPVLAEAQDNADGSPRSLCNANMSTPADGGSPRMQMYQCNNTSPERDGDFESVVIAHEYTHGVHSRLVPTSGNQVANEGWCDYFGMAVVAQTGDTYGGEYGVGDYLFGLGGTGIRSFPYSTDPSIFQLTYADLNGAAACAVKTCSSNASQTCNEDADCGAGNTCDARSCQYHEQCKPPATTIDQGLCRTSVYRTGEIWANALHTARQNLVKKRGFLAGGHAMDRLVIEGMKLSVDNPTLLDGRDAILAADSAAFEGANRCLIWDAFARFGMGFSAATTGTEDINPLEAFDVPPQCAPVLAISAASSLGTVCVGSAVTSSIHLYNTGAGELIVSKVERVSGSADVSLDGPPRFPVFLGPDSDVELAVRCSPTSGGTHTATFRVSSNDTEDTTQDVTVSCTGGQSAIAATLDRDFGDVCLGDRVTQNLTVSNPGTCPLRITSISSSNAEFGLATVASYPLVVAPGSELTLPIEFAPSGATGAEAGTLAITHNGAGAASPLNVSVSGRSDPAVLTAFIVADGRFGEVCAGDLRDLPVTVQNNGRCPLRVDGVSVSLGSNAQAGDFTAAPANGSVLSPGGSLVLPVRFQPSAFDEDPALVRQASVLISGRTLNASNALPGANVALRGAVPPPDIQVALADSGDFGKVCKGDHADLNVTLFNQGKCNLTISSIALVPGGDFELPAALTMPLVLSHDADFTLPVRFSPEDCSDSELTSTLVLTTDDPTEPSLNLALSGESPCPDLVIDAGSVARPFPPTVVDVDGSLGCATERTVALRNRGECPLTITSITANGTANPLDYRVAEPQSFPLVLPPGEETLGVRVRFTPQADGNPFAPTENTGLLSVASDDPNPVSAPLCGEAVAQSGTRILVTEVTTGQAVPLPTVGRIDLTSHGVNTPSPINLTFTNAPLRTATICGQTVRYHVEQENLPTVRTLGSNPKSSFQAAAKQGNLQTSQAFDVSQCEFEDFQLQLKR